MEPTNERQQTRSVASRERRIGPKKPSNGLWALVIGGYALGAVQPLINKTAGHLHADLNQSAIHQERPNTMVKEVALVNEVRPIHLSVPFDRRAHPD